MYLSKVNQNLAKIPKQFKRRLAGQDITPTTVAGIKSLLHDLQENLNEDSGNWSNLPSHLLRVVTIAAMRVIVLNSMLRDSDNPQAINVNTILTLMGTIASI